MTSNASGVPPASGAADEGPLVYPDVEGHLRDELWRVWLRVEFEIRRAWELGALPETNQESSPSTWGAHDLAGLFRMAHAEFSGKPVERRELGAKLLLDTYLRHSAALERRVERSLRAGMRLPLIEIVSSFGLSPRQRAALTLLLMAELDPYLLTAFRYLAHDASLRQVDGRLLALLVYDSPMSRAQLADDLSPDSPLVFFRLIEMDESAQRHDSPLFRRLRPAARLVPLLGSPTVELDARLRDVAWMPHAQPPGRFPEETLAVVMAALAGGEVLLGLQGQRGVGKRLLLQTAAARLGHTVIFVNGRALATRPPDGVRAIVRALVREARLLDAILVVPELDDAIPPEGDRAQAPRFLSMLCEDFRGPVAITVTGEDLPRVEFRPVVRVPVTIPNLGERAALWQHEVEGLSSGDAMALSERFAVPGGVIARAAAAARAGSRAAGDAVALPSLDRAVRGQLHDRMRRLGRKLETIHGFDDLVVDDDTATVLSEILSAVRERRQVRERWGFRGPQGVSVLFSGDPGVGKTMSARVMARALDLEIYEIDLSQVTSKWVGETEKNLGELFDSAEPGHVVLLFNEADSLFGRRTSEVKSANDRYANLETNYLLQRLERYNGLAILTTNLGKAIDPAFRRRFAYDVQFQFPTAAMRAELWRRAIPAVAMEEEIDFEELGTRFEMSGGFIKVAAERCAFQAAALKRSIAFDLIETTVERIYRDRGKLAPIGKLE